MPSLFRIGSYLVYFWSNENYEPIHVHISKGRPTPNATKVWLTALGGCIVANNSSKIPQHDRDTSIGRGGLLTARFF